MSQTLVLAAERPLWKDASLVIGASLVLGLLGQVMIPLPFTPVPLALRSQLVLLCGALLGPKRAALAVLGFLAQGLSGLPVFTHGATGWGALLGANGGYLVGYLAMALVTGYLAKKSTLLGLCAGTVVLYLFGAGYLATFVGIQKAFLMGVLPFLLGDALKIAMNWKLISWLRK